MIKKILLLVFVGAVGTSLYVYLQYNKPHQDIASTKPVATLKADELFFQFEDNELESNQLYLGKIVEVSGVVYSNEKGQDGSYNVLLMSDDAMFGVACNFEIDSLSELEKGDSVTIKGECAGMLSDVVLIRCVIVK